MMKLSLMDALVHTLTETHQSSIADQILTAWAHDSGSVRYFRASANFLFVFRQNTQPCFLRFVHASQRSVEAIEAELAFLHYLEAHGIRVALPIQSLSGRYVESMETPLGVVHAVVFAALSGEPFETDDLSFEQFRAWGQALGKLHLAAQGYAQAHRPTIDDHLALVDQLLPPHEWAARRLLTRLQPQIAVLPRREQTFGLIHYDFELDNLLWDDHDLGIVDFDDCAYYWFVADIAFALRDLFDDQSENIDLEDERCQAFFRGYRTMRPLSPNELLQLPLFLQIHHLVSFVKLLHASDIESKPETPEWVTTLQNRLVRKAQSYRERFAVSAAEHN